MLLYSASYGYHLFKNGKMEYFKDITKHVIK